MGKGGSLNQLEVEKPPNVVAESLEIGRATAEQIKAMKAASDISLKEKITGVAMWLLKFCIYISAGVYVFAVIMPWLSAIRGWNVPECLPADPPVILHYMIAAIVGYLFGQSGSKDQ